MADAFRMSDLGLLRYYLGIGILERRGMAGCNPCQVPMATCLKLSKRSTEPLVDATAYRSIVGSLRYLVNTRPNLPFVVGYVSRFLEEPRKDYLAVVKQILYYVAGTKSWGLRYKRKEEQV
ncbi:unnamed protein product [Spirodela intermedia]|uniref:Uncharacterized protein n=1 Tax=Spirodela intermedia TaxID=51605 RepID=A0A7I8LBU1_SPIIN|nr:unnamed protein product [Spirodela intermedia]